MYPRRPAGRQVRSSVGTAVACVVVAGIVAFASEASAASCSTFRPDARYGDTVQSLRVRGISCRAAKRKLQIFYGYDRDRGKYRPVRIGSLRCSHTQRTTSELYAYDGRCTSPSGSRYVRWVFYEYTG